MTSFSNMISLPLLNMRPYSCIRINAYLNTDKNENVVNNNEVYKTHETTKLNIIGKSVTSFDANNFTIRKHFCLCDIYLALVSSVEGILQYTATLYKGISKVLNNIPYFLRTSMHSSHLLLFLSFGFHFDGSLNSPKF